MCNTNNFKLKNNKTMEKTPKVSILVPIYNVEKYLKDCLDSLICQTLKDIEIICIDDGSTDNSPNILAEYAVLDSRIIVLTKENTGYGASMNLGLKCAKGEYIGIVESDDYALPEMFEKLYMMAKMYDVEIVKGNYYQVFSISREKKFIENLRGLPYGKVVNPVDEMECFSKPPSIWSGIYSRRFLKENEILFHESPGASFQDISFAFSVLYFARRVIFLKEAYLCYRCDNEGSSVRSVKKVFCVCEEMERIERLMGDQNQKLQQFMQSVKFSKYLYNYSRIDSIYQYAFLLKMHKEFEIAYQQGNLKKECWNHDSWQMMEEIRMTPDHFFERSNKDYINRYRLAPYILNTKIYINGLFDEMHYFSKVIIYGAGIYGKKALKMIGDRVPVYAFAVTDKKNNPEEINSIPVYEINTLIPLLQEEIVIVVAVNVKKQIEVVSLLWELGFRKIITLDTEMLNNDCSCTDIRVCE